MGKKCMNCGKGVMYGHNVSHSKRRTRKVFKPNLHIARIKLGSNYVRMRLCTKCLRLLKSASKEVEKASTKVVSQAAV
ncbi:MAG: 50S ribosomal protein L28 [Candidatus Levybacteria bacterium]|nr:50S ribosomal protein L28 [Candidatus Levybacteria bacterium]